MKAHRRHGHHLRNRFVAVISLGLLALGLVFDLNTRSELVVAIVFDIPIALSALSTSRRLPYLVTGVALAASAGAGYSNALANGVDELAILNRLLAALSYVLLGILTVALRRTITSETSLRLKAQRSEQESQLREMVAKLSEPTLPESFLRQAAAELRELLLADAIVVAGYDGERIREPRVVAPPGSNFAQVGELAPWPVRTLGKENSSVIAARVVADLILVGRWSSGEEVNLIVLARRPQRDESRALLSGALRFLYPLYERCCLIDAASKTPTV